MFVRRVRLKILAIISMRVLQKHGVWCSHETTIQGHRIFAHRLVKSDDEAAILCQLGHDKPISCIERGSVVKMCGLSLGPKYTMVPGISGTSRTEP